MRYLIDFAAMSTKEGRDEAVRSDLSGIRADQYVGHAGAEQRAGRTLARMAAKELALAEDGYILQLG
jgi:hypothetical protein